jgi:hypothetical protein
VDRCQWRLFSCGDTRLLKRLKRPEWIFPQASPLGLLGRVVKPEESQRLRE